MKWVKGFILAWGVMLLAACGGGGGAGDGGGFSTPNSIKVTATAIQTELPFNELGEGPDLSGRFTTEIRITATQSNGQPLSLPADSVQVSIGGSLTHGALVTFKPEDFSVELGDVTPGQCAFERGQLGSIDAVTGLAPCTVQGRFQALTTSISAGVGCCVYFHTDSDNRPGVATINVAVPDPNNNNQLVHASVNITVGAGTGSGRPAVVFISELTNSTLFVSGLGQLDAKPFRAEVFDEAGGDPGDGKFPTANPNGVNNVRVRIMDAPDGDEFLSGLNVNSSPVSSRGTAERAINIATTNGIAQFSLHSSKTAGVVRLRVEVDRDNNVDDGISDLIFDEETTFIVDGSLGSLFFLEPNPLLVAGSGGTTVSSIGSNRYSTDVSVQALDRNGNPMPAGIPIKFSVVDAPIIGYPQQGSGDFSIRRGQDNCPSLQTDRLGNPVENTRNFRIPFAVDCPNFSGVRPLDTLVLQGDEVGTPAAALHTGPWTVQTVIDSLNLSLTELLNSGADSGDNIPFIVGRNTHGVISPIISETNSNGIASATLTYPTFRLNQSIVITAEGFGLDSVNQTKVGTSIQTTYPNSIATGDRLALSAGGGITLSMLANSGLTFDLSLVDNNGYPVPGAIISYIVNGLDSSTVTINGSDSRSGALAPTDSLGSTPVTVFSANQTGDTAPVITFFTAGANSVTLNVNAIVAAPDARLALLVTPTAFIGGSANITALVVDRNATNAPPVAGVALTAVRTAGSTGTITPLRGITDINGIVTFKIQGGVDATTYVIALPDGTSIQVTGTVAPPTDDPVTNPNFAVVPTGPLDFGTVGLSNTSAEKVVSIVNTGDIALTLSTIELTGGDKANFTITSPTTTCTLNKSLAAGGSCQIGLTFTPTVDGVAQATLLVASSTITTGSNKLELVLTGTGKGGGTKAPDISVTPETVSFKTVVGVSSEVQVVTIRNVGQEVLSISSFEVVAATSNSRPQNFSSSITDSTIVVAKACTAADSLAVNESCSVGIQYTPSRFLTAEDVEQATLAIASNDPVDPVTQVALTGVGNFDRSLAFIPDPIDFGTVAFPGFDLADINVRNTTVNPLTIGVPTIVGVSFENFSIVPIVDDPSDPTDTPCVLNLVLKPADSCKIRILFTPFNFDGNFSAVLIVPDLTANNVPAVAITGIGQATGNLLEFTPVIFGDVEADITKSLTVHITNPTPTAIILGNLRIAGDAAFQVVVGTCTAGKELSANGGACDATVSFAASGAAGTRKAVLVVANSAGADVGAVDLSGTVVVPEPLVTFSGGDPIAFSDVEVGSTKTRSINVSNATSAALTLNGSARVVGDSAFKPTKDECKGKELAANGGSCLVEVTFTSFGAEGSRDAVLVMSDGVADVGSVNLTASVTVPDPKVNFLPPDGLDFGTLTGADDDLDRVINISNATNVEMTLGASDIAGASSVVDDKGTPNPIDDTYLPGFAIITDGCNGALLAAGGGSCQVTVRLTVGADNATFNGNLIITSGGVNVGSTTLKGVLAKK